MHLTVREEERIQIWAAAEMARRRLDKGLRLNYPETIAVIWMRSWSAHAKAASRC